MTVYQFRAVTGDDRAQSGQLEAASPSEAARMLFDRGLYPLEITPFGRSLMAILRTPIGGRAIAATDAAQILADLGHLVTAGIEVADAIAIILSTARRESVRSLIAKLLEAVRRGKPLSEALADSGAAFPPHVVAVVRASEMAGSLAAGLQHVAADVRRAIALHKQIQTALIYPACIAIAALGAITVLLVVVVPTLQSLFGDATHRLPWQTRALVETSQFVRAYSVAILLAVATCGVTGFLALRNESVRARLELLTLRAPGVGMLISAAETARVSRLLAVLTASRLPLVTAINLTGNGARLAASRRALCAAALKLREGAPLSQALSDVPALSMRLLTLVGIGETTGRLPELLEEAARGAEQTVTTAIERFLALLTPAMTLLFGILAGFVLYAVMTAILSVNDLATMGR